jgi:hypothetical protein
VKKGPNTKAIKREEKISKGQRRMMRETVKCKKFGRSVKEDVIK